MYDTVLQLAEIMPNLHLNMNPKPSTLYFSHRDLPESKRKIGPTKI